MTPQETAHPPRRIQRRQQQVAPRRPAPRTLTGMTNVEFNNWSATQMQVVNAESDRLDQVTERRRLEEQNMLLPRNEWLRLHQQQTLQNDGTQEVTPQETAQDRFSMVQQSPQRLEHVVQQAPLQQAVCVQHLQAPSQAVLQPQKPQPSPAQPKLHIRDYGSRKKPTINTLQSYGTIKRLVEAWYAEDHALVEKITKSNEKRDILGCASPKMTFSRIKRIHQRVNDKVEEMLANKAKDIKMSMTKRDKQLVAAQWLDLHERGDRTLNKYEDYIKSKFGDTYKGASRLGKKHARGE